MKLTNPYLGLAGGICVPSRPVAVENPQLLLWNAELARQLGLNVDAEQRAAFFAGNRLFEQCEPVALGYAGHQFGQFVPQLGDGRAHLLGAVTDQNGDCWDLQLKGSGATVFSRGGDGRCAIGPAVREFIMSEALHHLGVPTSRCLSVVSTGEFVFRNSALPGAVVTRVASSHIRVGSFQYLAVKQDEAALVSLLELAISRHYPDITERDDARILHFFDKVLDAQIALVVNWLRVGFIHGVMNTDNTLVSGETIDYGPCAMMNTFNFDTVFSSIDRQGRYAYGNQPNIAHWNMARLAESLIALFECDEKEAVAAMSGLLDQFSERFNQAFAGMWAEKLALPGAHPDDQALVSELLTLMHDNRLDFTNTFDALSESLNAQDIDGKISEPLKTWLPKWQTRIAEQDREFGYQRMRAANPALIPRNHLVEEILADYEQAGHSDKLAGFLSALRTPYQPLPQQSVYRHAPEGGDKGYKTYCGT